MRNPFRRTPEPPTNVQVADHNGRWWAVDCVYAGRERRLDVWEIIVPPALEHPVALRIEVLPERSLVRLTAEV